MVGLNNKFNDSEDSDVSVFMVACGGIKSKVGFQIKIEPRTSRERREHEYRTATLIFKYTIKKFQSSFVNGGLCE
jgi:hypothetical protein